MHRTQSRAARLIQRTYRAHRQRLRAAASHSLWRCERAAQLLQRFFVEHMPHLSDPHLSATDFLTDVKRSAGAAPDPNAPLTAAQLLPLLRERIGRWSKAVKVQRFWNTQQRKLAVRHMLHTFFRFNINQSNASNCLFDLIGCWGVIVRRRMWS